MDDPIYRLLWESEDRLWWSSSLRGHVLRRLRDLLPQHSPRRILDIGCGAGRLMQSELKALTGALDRAARPLMAIVGGAKVSTKVAVLGNLVGKVDVLAIGGGMANTFLAAQGIDVGKSLNERDMAGTARDIMARAIEQGCEIALPIDAVIARQLKDGAASQTVMLDRVPATR